MFRIYLCCYTYVKVSDSCVKQEESRRNYELHSFSLIILDVLILPFQYQLKIISCLGLRQNILVGNTLNQPSHNGFLLNHAMNIYLQIKFRRYIIKTQDSRLKIQDSRLKNQYSILKNQKSTIHSAQAGKPGLASQPGQPATNQRWPIKQNSNGKWPNKQASCQSFPDYIQSKQQSIQDLHHHHGQRMSLNITRILYGQSSKYLSFYYCKYYCKIKHKD